MLERKLLALAALPLGFAQEFHHQTEQEEVFWLSLTLLVFAVVVLTFPLMSSGQWRGWWGWSPAHSYGTYYVADTENPGIPQGIPVPRKEAAPASPQKMDPPSYSDVTAAPAATQTAPAPARFSYFSSTPATGAARDRARLTEVPAVFPAQGPGFKM